MFRLLIAAVALLASVCTAQDSKPPENDRLIQTAKLWIAVKYFHPYLAYRGIDWDKALIDALPHIRAAKNPDEYTAALQSMLGVLQDAATRIGEGHELNESGGQRNWIHYGFPPESGADPGFFYSAFGARPGTFAHVIALPLSDGITAWVRLSEPAQSASIAVPTLKPDVYPLLATPRLNIASSPPSKSGALFITSSRIEISWMKIGTRCLHLFCRALSLQRTRANTT